MKKDERLYDKIFFAGGILFRLQVFMPFSFLFLFILKFGSFCYGTLYDISWLKYDTQSSYEFTPELFKYSQLLKLSKKFCFHRNQCKIQIMYGNANDS